MIDKEQLNSLYRYAVSISHEPQQAYDLVHAALARFIEPPQPELQDPLPYLRRSIRNESIDIYRKLQRQRVYIEQQSGLAVEMDIQGLEQLLIDERTLEPLLQKISSEEREILYLWAVEGYTTQEVADLLGMPKGTVLSKIHRLRQNLKTESSDLQEARI